MGPRDGPMYDHIALEAKAAGLPLKWRDRLPNSRMALAAVEWTRVHAPSMAGAEAKATEEGERKSGNEGVTDAFRRSLGHGTKG